MERIIGDQFKIWNTWYEVIEGTPNRCDNCCFNPISCIKVKDHFGFCSSDSRSDHRNIAIKEIGK